MDATAANILDRSLSDRVRGRLGPGVVEVPFISVCIFTPWLLYQGISVMRYKVLLALAVTHLVPPFISASDSFETLLDAVVNVATSQGYSVSGFHWSTLSFLIRVTSVQPPPNTSISQYTW